MRFVSKSHGLEIDSEYFLRALKIRNMSKMRLKMDVDSTQFIH